MLSVDVVASPVSMAIAERRFQGIQMHVTMRFVALVLHLFTFVSCSFDAVIDDRGQQEKGTSPPLSVPTVLQPRGHFGLGSTVCESRGRCGGVEASAVTSSNTSNCFCDRLCGYYDDCCEDYRSKDGADYQFAHLPRGVATCQRMDDTETGNSIEIYKVSRCPKDFNDGHTRRLCEAEVGPATSDRFILLPVAGNTSLVLYKNIYCAICAGERHPIFWLGKLRCGRGQVTMNQTGDLKEIIRSACPAEFVPASEWGGDRDAPRRCTSHIARCDSDWTDDSIRRKCRLATNYVFAGNRAFRNKHCAQCNYVNETYLRCDDVRPPPRTYVTSGGDFKWMNGSVVTLDFNGRRAVVMETKPGSDYVTETRIEFPACSTEGSVYDPFTDVCRKITCPPEMDFSAGNCFVKPALQNDGASEESAVVSRDEEVEKSNKGYDVRINDDDDTNEPRTYTSTFFNSTAVSKSPVALTTATATLPLEPMRMRFVLFRMSALQRLFSILGTLFCVLCISVFLVLYLCYDVLRTDPANRYAVSLSVCLVVGHLLFVFIVIPTDEFPGPITCFCLSIVIQYAYITAFFWLNVMSIDAFKRLTAAPQAAQEASNTCACFALFSLYAWVVPSVLIAASTAIAVLRVDGWDQLNEGGKVEGCFVLGLSQLLLFIVPIALIVTTNIAMYVIVTCRICIEPRPIRKDPEHFRQTVKDRKLFVTCVQLTVVMTTTWVMALVAYLTGLSFLWYIFIVFDTLQGVSIVAAFVLKVKVWHLFNGRSVTITRPGANPNKRAKRQQRSSDEVDTAIEPFVDGLSPQGEAPVAASNSRIDAILRETSI